MKTANIRRFRLPLVLSFGLLLSSATAAQVLNDRPNVLLIVLDDFGIENLGFYGYNPGEIGCCPPVPCPLPGSLPPPLVTDRLQDLAANGVVFRRAYSYPVCSSTRAAIMTGRHAFRTGMGGLASSPIAGALQIDLAERTIAEMLKNGFPSWIPKYKCGFFGKWDIHQGDAMPQDGSYPGHVTSQGFDRFFGPSGVNDGDHFLWNAVTGVRSPPSATYEQVDRFSAAELRGAGFGLDPLDQWAILRPGIV